MNIGDTVKRTNGDIGLGIIIQGLKDGKVLVFWDKEIFNGKIRDARYPKKTWVKVESIVRF